MAVTFGTPPWQSIDSFFFRVNRRVTAMGKYPDGVRLVRPVLFIQGSEKKIRDGRELGSGTLTKKPGKKP